MDLALCAGLGTASKAQSIEVIDELSVGSTDASAPRDEKVASSECDADIPEAGIRRHS